MPWAFWFFGKSGLAWLYFAQQLLQGNKAEEQEADYNFCPPAAQCAVERNVGLHYAHNQHAHQCSHHIAIAAG